MSQIVEVSDSGLANLFKRLIIGTCMLGWGHSLHLLRVLLVYSEHQLKNMTGTMLNLTSQELSALKAATRARFGSESRISRGAMVRLMAEETIAEYEESDE